MRSRCGSTSSAPSTHKSSVPTSAGVSSGIPCSRARPAVASDVGRPRNVQPAADPPPSSRTNPVAARPDPAHRRPPFRPPARRFTVRFPSRSSQWITDVAGERSRCDDKCRQDDQSTAAVSARAPPISTRANGSNPPGPKTTPARRPRTLGRTSPPTCRPADFERDQTRGSTVEHQQQRYPNRIAAAASC